MNREDMKRSLNTHYLVGYSSETKPEGYKGQVFMELDTENIFIHDGNDWVVF